MHYQLPPKMQQYDASVAELHAQQPGQGQQRSANPPCAPAHRQVIITFPASGTVSTQQQQTEYDRSIERTDLDSSEQHVINQLGSSHSGSAASCNSCGLKAAALGISQRTLLILLLVVVAVALVVQHSYSSDSHRTVNDSWSTSLRLPQAVDEEYDTLDALPGSSSNRRSDLSSNSLDSSSSSSSGCSSSSGTGVKCPYGSLPGTWVAAAAAGARWQTLDQDCQLKNWLELYTAAAAAAATHSSSDGDSDAQDIPRAVRILLLSDSVDRYIIQHVCDHIGGTKQTHSMHSTPAAEAAEAAAEHLRQQQQQQQPDLAAAAAAAHAPAPTLLNKTAYAFHTCSSAAPIKLASSYFPGVHPTGPYHRYSAQNYKQRIDSAREMWTQYSGLGNEPDMVSVASLLWDVARMYMHEREKIEGREYLDREVLDGWLFNFTQVVAYAKEKFPKTQLWMTHTTMPPHHSVISGLMTKPYLGRRYLIQQLNAAAATAARKLNMQLVDYAAIAAPFAEGQKHLVDLIHPNALVAIEVFNVMLNLVLEQQQQ